MFAKSALLNRLEDYMPSFEELGLRPELLRTLEDEDLARPTALQEAVIPALRRGSNLVARASTGSGKTLAYSLGVLDRLTPREGAEEGDEVALRFLVLAATATEAERVAFELFPFAQAMGLTVTVPGGSWGTAAAQADVVVAPVADIVEAVQGSELKLDELEAVVVDGAAAIHHLGDWERVDTLLDLLPRDAQRVVVSASFPAEVSELIDRRVKRALRYPAEPAIPDAAPPAPAAGKVGYVLVAGGDKLEVLARQLSQGKEESGPPPVIYCRSDERAAEVAEILSVRGFAVGSADDAEVDVAVAAADTTREELLAEAEEGLGQTISFDVPSDAATLLARHGGDEDAVIMVEPRELPHVRELGRAANFRVRALPLPVEQSAATAELNAFREQVRRAVGEEDLTAQMLVLAPLFDELGAAEVAAACAAPLRRRGPTTASAAPEPSRPAAAASAAATSAETGPAPKPWTRLYVGIGSRDDIRPGDLVGALAGESDIKGAQIGKIEIRDSFSVVEVEADVADRVIRAVNGTTIKGRSVRVDYDRPGPRPQQRRQGNRPGGPGGGGGAGAPRRGPGGPGRGGDGGPRRVVKRPRDDR